MTRAPIGGLLRVRDEEDEMADIVYVVLILAGFALCALVLRALRIHGENR